MNVFCLYGRLNFFSAVIDSFTSKKELVKKGGVLPRTKSCPVGLVSFVCVCLCVTNVLKQFGDINKLERKPFQLKLVFICGSSCPDRIGILKYWFSWKEENRRTRRKNPRNEDDNQPTQPI